MFRIFSTLVICISLLTSCGFKALYKNEPVSGPLNAIEISPVASIEGAELHHYLSDLLPITLKPLYNLKISFTYIASPIAIQKNSDIIRENISQIIQYELLYINTGKVVTSGKFKQMTSYNSTFTPYGSHIERELATTNLTKHSAEEIRRRLILHFKSQGNGV